MLTDTDLINYLHTLAEQLKNGTLDVERQQEITMMFLRHRYSKNREVPSELKRLNYVSLGWYIYEFLLKK